MVNRPGADKLAVVRPAIKGDLIVMLATVDNQLPKALERHISRLKAVISGYPPDLFHVTLQRFAPIDDTSGEKLFSRLQEIKDQFQPLDIVADGYLPIYSDYRKFHILKWTVPGNELLRKWYRTVDSVGMGIGIQPLYLRQGYGAWVTALIDIDQSRPTTLEDIPIPQPLFCVNRLVISRLLEPRHYELVGEFIFS